MLTEEFIQSLRDKTKEASAVRFIESRYGVREPGLLEQVEQIKTASADPVLLNVARHINPQDPFSAYEALGGDYNNNREGVLDGRNVLRLVSVR